MIATVNYHSSSAILPQTSHKPLIISYQSSTRSTCSTRLKHFSCISCISWFRYLCALSALASLGVFASPWVANPLKGRIRVSATLRYRKQALAPWGMQPNTSHDESPVLYHLSSESAYYTIFRNSAVTWLEEILARAAFVPDILASARFFSCRA